MQKFWNNLSIVYKLFLTLFGGIAVIVIILLSYLWGYESEQILTKEKKVLHSQSLLVANDLKNHIDSLQKEALFLSRLEIMNDIVTKDIDMRITQLLEQKAEDLGESISIFVVDSNSIICASSQKNQKNKLFALNNAISVHKTYFYTNKNLYLLTPVYGSFDSMNLLGYLILSYPLENFTFKPKDNESFHLWLTPPEAFSYINKDTMPVKNIQEYLYEKIPLSGVLNGWTLHYAMPKNETLTLLYHFQTVLLVMLIISLIFIAFLIWIIVHSIVKPLHHLSNMAKNIAKTGDYTQSFEQTGNDEIGIVAHSFNTLISTTLASMERTELLGKMQVALQAKSSFLSAMSHELRTPLGSILSLTQYMATHPDMTENMGEAVGKIENSAYHLLGVINNILDLAKAESGKMVPLITKCNPLTIVEDALELVMPLAEDKGLSVHTEFEKVKSSFLSDERLLRQIFINLLSNAIKFTDKGSIELKFTSAKNICSFEIKDSGCGIAQESLKHLFDEFYQVRPSNGLEGSGLGLAISKKLAQLLQGDLFITSEGEEKGTTAVFYFQSF